MKQIVGYAIVYEYANGTTAATMSKRVSPMLQKTVLKALERVTGEEAVEPEQEFITRAEVVELVAELAERMRIATDRIVRVWNRQSKLAAEEDKSPQAPYMVRSVFSHTASEVGPDELGKDHVLRSKA
jgi:hypothetical protein